MDFHSWNFLASSWKSFSVFWHISALKHLLIFQLTSSSVLTPEILLSQVLHFIYSISHPQVTKSSLSY